MPQYYFDLHHDGTTIPDEDGQYERNARDAWNAARKVACDLMQIELDPPINWQKWHFSISERGSQIVLECPFVGAALPKRKLILPFPSRGGFHASELSAVAPRATTLVCCRASASLFFRHVYGLRAVTPAGGGSRLIVMFG